MGKINIMKHSYRLVARPSKSGFFGLTIMKDFINNNLDVYSRAGMEDLVVLDFSLIKIWDIAALQWLVVALYYYKKNGLTFLLQLPDGRYGKNDKEIVAFNKSAEYLRRWRFDIALLNLDPLPSNLLVYEQQDYFSDTNEYKYYVERSDPSNCGILESFISRRLMHIRNLVDLKEFGSGKTSNRIITDWISYFQNAKIGEILRVQCGVPIERANLFSETLITESLMNVMEHPNATIGMMAVSIMGYSKELLLCVVDNGVSIPGTIYQRYNEVNECVGEMFYDYEREKMPFEKVGDIAAFATKKGITRKVGVDAENAGNGLTYIIDDTICEFDGKITIITDGVCLKFDKNNKDYPVISDWSHPWGGNLLRISLPIKAQGC